MNFKKIVLSSSLPTYQQLTNQKLWWSMKKCTLYCTKNWFCYPISDAVYPISDVRKWVENEKWWLFFESRKKIWKTHDIKKTMLQTGKKHKKSKKYCTLVKICLNLQQNFHFFQKKKCPKRVHIRYATIIICN